MIAKTDNSVRHKFDGVASDYSGKYEHPTNIFGVEKVRRLELLLEHAQLLKPESTLDAGCGPGVALSALVHRLPGAKFAGVDLSFQMVKQARAESIKDLSFAQSSVEQLPFPDDSFDLIYALGVLDYLETPDLFFEAAQRTLRPGGHFIFTYPNADSITRSIRTSLRTHLRPSQAAISATPINETTIDRLIASSGFKLLTRYYFTYGNGLVSLPWSVAMNSKMEKWCSQKPIGRYLAWSGFCVARKDSNS